MLVFIQGSIDAVGQTVIEKTAEMVEACERKNKNVLCGFLKISPDRLLTLVELLKMCGSSLNCVVKPKHNPGSNFSSYNANIDTDEIEDAGSSSSRFQFGKSSVTKRQENDSVIRRLPFSSTNEEEHDVINLESPPPKGLFDNYRQFKTPVSKNLNKVEAYDFFGAASSPSFFRDEDDEDDCYPTTDSDYLESSSNSGQQVQSSVPSFASPMRKSQPGTSKSVTPVRLGSASPGGKIDPNKFHVGKFTGNVVNDGTSGEFDGFRYAHSKMMLTVTQ